MPSGVQRPFIRTDQLCDVRTLTSCDVLDNNESAVVPDYDGDGFNGMKWLIST
jgi:23S rRNA U2552 (ribose-2'-O)-methylase RlmE/FtsJ